MNANCMKSKLFHASMRCIEPEHISPFCLSLCIRFVATDRHFLEEPIDIRLLETFKKILSGNLYIDNYSS